MAQTQPTTQQPASVPKMIKGVRVVTNYGRHLAGAIIDLPEEHYLKLRRSDGRGGHTFPVVISLADDAALAVKAKADEEARLKSERAADTDRSTSAGWAEHRRKSEEIARAEMVKRQRETHALVIGEQATPDPAEVERKFREGVRASRG